MKSFADLFQALDRSRATTDKRDALLRYFASAPAADAAWAVHLLAGGKVGGGKAGILARSAELRLWISQESATPLWLVEQSYEQVGDLAETLTLLLDNPSGSAPEESLADWIEQRLLPVAGAAASEREAVIVSAWRALPFNERLVFNKLLTGALRIGVSQTLVQQALAQHSGIDIALIAQRMLGDWTPTADAFERLLSREALESDRYQPFPFFLASPLTDSPEDLGPIDEWLLEWKWDGIRLQLIRREGEIALWSRGEERLDGRFPEIEEAAAKLPIDCVLDGELLAWSEEALPLPFTALQKRIQRRKPGPKLLKEAPAKLLVYDLLEVEGEDLRDRPLNERREALQRLVRSIDDPRLRLSPEVSAESWRDALAQRDEARARGVEGLMLKRRSSAYQRGRKRGDWWKWKVDPLVIDAVLLYAQAGHGRRSSLYTDYTFGVWDEDRLVPVAKAYSGLDDREILLLDKWIRTHTVERFGPVRSVTPQHVFELGFEGVNRSARHKSGVAVRFPRILRWRHDKTPAEADRLDALQRLAPP